MKFANFLNLKTVYQLIDYLDISINSLEQWCVNPSYKTYVIKKKTGGVRYIYEPDETFKPTLQKLKTVLQKIYTYHNSTGDTFSIKKHAGNHTQKNHILTVDIEEFYSSITAGDIKNIFLLKPFQFPDNVATILAIMVSYKGKLPTGSPVAPVIANFAFTFPDFILLKYAQKNNLTYSRYVDDLTFSSNAFINEHTIADISTIIKKFGFSLNSKKTRFMSKHQSQTVTGIKVNKKVNVSRKYIKNLRTIIHNIETKGIDYAVEEFNRKRLQNSNTITYADTFDKTLIGMVNFIAHIRGTDDTVYNKLKERLKSCLINQG